MFVKRCSGAPAAFVAILVSSCAVGPDVAPPAAPPDVSRYTKEPLATHTSSTDAAFGKAQHFVQGREISAEWWRLFRSPGLNALIQKSLDANPTLQAAIASLRTAKEGVYAQQGKYFPLVQANLSPSRSQTAANLSPVPASGASVFDLYTAQVLVSYTFDVWGLNRRAVESLQAQADFQRFQVEAAYLTLTANEVVAAIQEASLRGQIDATHEIIAINTKMLDILKNQFANGYASRSDVAAQEAALAQVAATLPPLRKALAVQRDLLHGVGRPVPEPGGVRDLQARSLAATAGLAGQPALTTSRAASRRAFGGGATAFGRRARRRRHRQHAAEYHAQRQRRLYGDAICRIVQPAQPVLDHRRQRHAVALRWADPAASKAGGRGDVRASSVGLSRHRHHRAAERRRYAAGAAKRRRCLESGATSSVPPRSASIWRSSSSWPAKPALCCCSTRSKPISSPSSSWCRRRPTACPTPQPCSRRSAAAGGTGSNPRPS
jgi:hypothetical protein